MMGKTATYLILLIFLFVSVFYGCATKGYDEKKAETGKEDNNTYGTTDLDLVRVEVEMNQADIQDLKNSVEMIQTKMDDEIGNLKEITAKQQKQLDKELGQIREAMGRARQTGKISKGNIVMEATISEDSILFGFDKSNLTEEAEVALDVFAGILITENNGVYIEIQGHTDNVGASGYNRKLAIKRANSAKDYLYLKHGIPLHRMSTYSYGETMPIADNSTKEGRSKNRRVVLIVME
jgi:outer membrane protein OmpA-like peptidoglycan-associated protein